MLYHQYELILLLSNDYNSTEQYVRLLFQPNRLGKKGQQYDLFQSLTWTPKHHLLQAHKTDRLLPILILKFQVQIWLQIKLKKSHQSTSSLQVLEMSNLPRLSKVHHFKHKRDLPFQEFFSSHPPNQACDLLKVRQKKNCFCTILLMNLQYLRNIWFRIKREQSSRLFH